MPGDARFVGRDLAPFGQQVLAGCRELPFSSFNNLFEVIAKKAHGRKGSLEGFNAERGVMQPISAYFNPQRLQRFRNQLAVERANAGVNPFNQRDPSYGVGRDTIRGFHGFTKPLTTYRKWAEAECSRLNATVLQSKVSSAAAFEDWHRSLRKSLQRHWRMSQGQTLKLAHLFKLIDLFVKWLSTHDFGVPNITQGLLDYGHCALDSKTLDELNKCLSMALPIFKPRMGHITSRVTYDFCQDLLRELSVQCGGTPLLFDYYAWK